jgi:methanogenic corrinoid protein MtbC1
MHFIQLEENETPDFIGTTLTQTIAIEHMRYINESKKIESFRKQVIEQARTKFENEIGINLEY